MKRITAIIAAFILTLTSLAACGNSDTPTSEVNPDSFSGTSATENPISSEDNSSDVDNSVPDDETEVSGETDMTDDYLPTVTTTADDDKTVPTTTTTVSGNDEEKPVTTTAEDKKDTAATTTSKKVTTTVKETTTKKPTTTTKVTTTKKQTTTTKVTTEKKPTTTTKKPETEKPKAELTQADIDRLVKELQEYSDKIYTEKEGHAPDENFEPYTYTTEKGTFKINTYEEYMKSFTPEECSWDSPVTIFKDISYEKALEYGKSQVEEAYYAFDSHAVVYARWCPKGKGCANEFWNSETGYTQEDCWDIYALI